MTHQKTKWAAKRRRATSPRPLDCERRRVASCSDRIEPPKRERSAAGGQREPQARALFARAAAVAVAVAAEEPIAARARALARSLLTAAATAGRAAPRADVPTIFFPFSKPPPSGILLVISLRRADIGKRASKRVSERRCSTSGRLHPLALAVVAVAAVAAVATAADRPNQLICRRVGGSTSLVVVAAAAADCCIHTLAASIVWRRPPSFGACSRRSRRRCRVNGAPTSRKR